MQEETKIDPQTNLAASPNPTLPEWLNFKSKHDDITSKVEMRRDFYEETKANAKKLRSNKKNPTKQSTYYTASSPLHPSKSEDHIYQTALPNTITYTYEGLGSRLYNCKFTHDGKILLVTSQTGTAFFNFSDDNKIELSKVIVCNNINWAITDSDISSDNKFMIHSTLSPYVHLFDVEKSKYIKQFNIRSGRQSATEEDEEEETGYWHYSTRVFSLKLSGDGREVIAGCGRTTRGAPVQVYDLVQGKLKHSIIAHQDDINSICYVDRENSSIFISGSDDGKCKLWDTRILQDNKPVGVFHGHCAGLTCVSSKEDNRYFISNSKDQSIKLWDIRTADSEERRVPLLGFDYRYQRLGWNVVEKIQATNKKNDQSVMTFWGHQVYSTLIRCHFSPLFGTGQRYIYTGSGDGKVYIYDTVTGNNIVRLNLPNENSGYDEYPLVRDCAWHPYSQNLISTSFLEGIQRWEYMDLRDAEKIEEEEEWEDEGDEVQNGGQAIEDDDDDEEDEEYYEEDDDDYDPKEEGTTENESSEQEATH